MTFDKSKIPNDLIHAFKNHKGGVFVGAGLSQAAGLPSWTGLLSDLIELAEKVSYKPNVDFIDSCKKLLSDSSKFLILAQELKDFLGDSFRKYIIKKFSDECPPPTQLHFDLIRYPYQFNA